MAIRALRRLAAAALLGTMLLVFPAVTAATITGPCTATGLASSGNVDLTTATEWHLRTTDIAGGEGSSTVPMTSASVAAYAFGGIGIPIAGGSGTDPRTEGSVNGLQVSQFAILGARFYVAGSAAGDNGASCSGSIVIVIDDVNPAVTVLGGGALAAALIGVLTIVLGTRLTPTIVNRVFVGIVGFLGGIGAAVSAAQFGILDPSQLYGLIVPIVMALLGFGCCGLLHKSPPPVTPAPAA